MNLQTLKEFTTWISVKMITHCLRFQKENKGERCRIHPHVFLIAHYWVKNLFDTLTLKTYVETNKCLAVWGCCAVTYVCAHTNLYKCTQPFSMLVGSLRKAPRLKGDWWQNLHLIKQHSIANPSGYRAEKQHNWQIPPLLLKKKPNNNNNNNLPFRSMDTQFGLGGKLTIW